MEVENMDLTCPYCEKGLGNIGGFNNHVRRCRPHAKRIANALNGYQDFVDPPLRKRARRQFLPLDESDNDNDNEPGPSNLIEPTPIVAVVRYAVTSTATASVLTLSQDASQDPVATVPSPRQSPTLPRAARTRRPNVLYRDFVDSREERGEIEALDHATDDVHPIVLPNSDLTVYTNSDSYGLRHYYLETPGFSPHPIAVAQAGGNSEMTMISGPARGARQPLTGQTLGPYRNQSELLLTDWFSRHPRNTVNSFKELCNMIKDPSFNPDELPSANVMLRHLSTLGAIDQGAEAAYPPGIDADAGWQKSSVTITVPFKFHKPTELNPHPHFEKSAIYDPSVLRGGPQEFTVTDFYHRSLVGIIRSRLQSKAFQQMHLHPYDLRWKPGADKAEVRVYGEMFTSPEFMAEHIKVQNSAPRPHCHPRVVLALIYFSDGTHLTSFGDAYFWPGYLQLGNNSKYDRLKPSSHMTEHFAYFRKLPPNFKKFVFDNNDGQKTVSQILTHCRRELFQAQWEVILDEEFVDAYENGLLVECYDGVWRLFFPRIFVYAADYPEKVMIATIKYLSLYPCPRCYVKMEDIAQLGTAEDQHTRSVVRVDDKNRKARVRAARNLVYKKSKSLQSTKLNKYLEEGSYTITESAFSKKLSKFGFNFYNMFRTELLHEWSSNGEGKKVHLHLLRILDTVPSSLGVLDWRYQEIPTFGKDGIRRFRASVSEASFHAARDIEDVIQCALPVYEDLLPEPFNGQILDLLYTMADWHALARLRLHTDHTLRLLDLATAELGDSLRFFVDEICPNFKTMELKHETNKRIRRSAKTAASKGEESTSGPVGGDSAKGKDKGKGKQKAQNAGGKGTTKEGASRRGGKSRAKSGPTAKASDEHDPSREDSSSKSGDGKAVRLECKVKLNSSKLHALGDVANNIRDLGTTDSYSAEFGEAEHRIGKRRYPRTDKREYLKQLAQLDRREARLREIRRRIETPPVDSDGACDDYLPQSPNINVHHEIGLSQNNMIRIDHFMSKYRGDPSVWDFLTKLKRHLLPRVRSLARDQIEREGGDASVMPSLTPPHCTDDYLNVVFKNSESIFSHNVMRVNYNAYDTRRLQDVMNPKTDHKDFMVLSGSPTTRYRYARLIGVFHAIVRYNGPGTSVDQFFRVEFLWVRWFKTVSNLPRRLECLEFVPFEEEDAVGFLDPSEIIRAVHIMPRFAKGYAHPDRKGFSTHCHDGSDYRQYYVGRFSDRDLYMRWLWGLAVGHTYTHEDAPDEPPNDDHRIDLGSGVQPETPGFTHDPDLDGISDSENDSGQDEIDPDPKSDSEFDGDEDGDEMLLIDDDELDDETLYARYGPG